MTLYLGDCLEVMRTLPDRSVDAVIADPPYGTTACKWDSVIPLAPMWEQLRRVAKPNAAVVLFAAQPFTSALVMSNPRAFKHEWVWDKRSPVGHLNVKVMPLQRHESITVFCGGKLTYYPQMTTGEYKKKGGYGHLPNRGSYGEHGANKPTTYNDQYYPTSVLVFPRVIAGRTHPNEKPADLLAYLVRTYTKANDTVLDFCMGSGTTGVACVQEGRDFIGIEQDAGYFASAKERIYSQRLDD